MRTLNKDEVIYKFLIVHFLFIISIILFGIARELGTIKNSTILAVFLFISFIVGVMYARESSYNKECDK